MNNAIKMLYDEHDIIVNAADTAKQAKELIGKDDALYADIVSKLVHFFKNYADRYHHHKEEEILFPEMSKKNELLGEGVIKEMLDNHEDFRVMIQAIEKALNEKNYPLVQQKLEQYTESLLDHIAVENDEVFQMAETLMDDNELNNIGYKFQDCDRELGDSMKQELVELAESLSKVL